MQPVRIAVVTLAALAVFAACACADPPGQPVASDVASNGVTLETALEWTLTRSPDLVAMRENLGVSAEAIRVARRFPTSLNPTVSITAEPWVFERAAAGQIDRLKPMFSVSWEQPVELGHRTAYRTAIAQASYCQTKWNIVQAELMALVETYRVYQGAAYRRDKLAVARQIAQSQAHLLQTLHNQREANRVAAADVVLGEAESVAVDQAVETAEQEYASALVALRRRIGVAQYAASIEPAGALLPPQPTAIENEEAMVATALGGRPDVLAARAQTCVSRAAIDLARADRIPIPSIGPAYEHNESGATFYGLALTSPIPVLNSGKPLVLQREAEYRRDVVALEQTQERVRAEVLTSLARWKQVQQSLARGQTWAQATARQAAAMRELYDAGQADLVKLLTVRRRLIDVESARLDTVWNAIQAYADVLGALGATPLLGAAGDER